VVAGARGCGHHAGRPRGRRRRHRPGPLHRAARGDRDGARGWPRRSASRPTASARSTCSRCRRCATPGRDGVRRRDRCARKEVYLATSTPTGASRRPFVVPPRRRPMLAAGPVVGEGAWLYEETFGDAREPATCRRRGSRRSQSSGSRGRGSRQHGTALPPTPRRRENAARKRVTQHDRAAAHAVVGRRARRALERELFPHDAWSGRAAVGELAHVPDTAGTPSTRTIPASTATSASTPCRGGRRADHRGGAAVQGRGLGRELLDALVAEARLRGCAQLFLEVLDGNSRPSRSTTARVSNGWAVARRTTARSRRRRLRLRLHEHADRDAVPSEVRS